MASISDLGSSLLGYGIGGGLREQRHPCKDVRHVKNLHVHGREFQLVVGRHNGRGREKGRRRFLCLASTSAADLPAKDGVEGKKKATEKVEFDNIQDLIVSQPSSSSPSSSSSTSVSSSSNVSGSASASTGGGQPPPTLLEREAEALEGSAPFSGHERTEAMSGLLDLLEQKGVTSAYAFEFVRHAGDLIDDLFIEAKERTPDSTSLLREARETFIQTQDENFPSTPPIRPRSPASDTAVADFKREKIDRLIPTTPQFPIDIDRAAGDHELAFRVSECAERRGLGNIVCYFQIIGMKAQNVPPLLPFLLEQGIEMAIAKVEFLRSLGIKYSHVPGILERWPELLRHGSETLVGAAEFLVDRLGLAHQDVGRMVIKFPEILGRAADGELLCSVEDLARLGVAVEDVKRLVVRYPILLTDDARGKLSPLVRFLEDLGVRTEHIGTLLLRRPLLLDSDVELDLVPVGEYLRSLNATPDDIDKILMSFPQLFAYDVEQEFRPTVLYLEKLGVEPNQMGKLFRRHPALLKNRKNFDLKLEFLLNLGLDRRDLGKVIFNAPQLLCLSVADNMEPTVAFFASIGIKGSSLIKLLKLKPMILAYSVKQKLKRNVAFLESLDITHEEIAKMVARHPQLLTLNVEKNLEPTVAFLLDLGFTRADVGNMVRKLPSLLGFGVLTKLEPKLRYLLDVMERDLRELVLFPHFFSYSLSNRIIPRHQKLGHHLSGSLSLNSIYGCSDVIFETKAAKWLMREIQI